MADTEYKGEMSDADKLFMFYTLALQALSELGRPLLLNTKFVEEIIEGKWEVFSSRTDDGGWLYKAQKREVKDGIHWNSGT